MFNAFCKKFGVIIKIDFVTITLCNYDIMGEIGWLNEVFCMYLYDETSKGLFLSFKINLAYTVNSCFLFENVVLYLKKLKLNGVLYLSIKLFIL